MKINLLTKKRQDHEKHIIHLAIKIYKDSELEDQLFERLKHLYRDGFFNGLSIGWILGITIYWFLFK